MKVVARRRVLQKWLRTSKKKQPPFRRKKKRVQFRSFVEKKRDQFRNAERGIGWGRKHTAADAEEATRIYLHGKDDKGSLYH
jgi:hypothetical protein